MNWQPIATAPKDGTPVLLFKHGWPFAAVGRWGPHPEGDGNGEYFDGWLIDEGVYIPGAFEEGFVGWNEEIDDGLMPTHWIPEPPKAVKS